MRITLTFTRALGTRSALWASAFADESRTNVIVMLADDLGSQDLGCDGGPVKTPALRWGA